MLHRGKYAIETKPGESPATAKRRFTWGSILGFSYEFTLGDKILSISLFVWNIFWFCVFLVGTIWYWLRPWPLQTWGYFWYYTGIVLPFVIGIVTTIWFTWGGIRDLKRLFVALRTIKRNKLDDGVVVGHHNLDEPEMRVDKPAKASQP